MINLQFDNFDLTDFHAKQREFAGKKPPSELPNVDVIDSPCTIYINGELAVYYSTADWDTSPLRAATRSINYKSSGRAGGLKTVSRTFGYKPRYALRSDYCCASSFANEQPLQHSIVCQAGAEMSRLYKGINPTLYEKHLELATRVNADYLIKDTVYTSGIVNKNNPLFYHFDAGNFKNVWSGMIVFKKSIGGGDLHFPGLNLKFVLNDNSIIFFDGQSLVHGVTPIEMQIGDGYRYTIVYYSMEQMCKCLSMREELARVQQKSMEKAKGRMGKINAARTQ